MTRQNKPNTAARLARSTDTGRRGDGPAWTSLAAHIACVTLVVPRATSPPSTNDARTRRRSAESIATRAAGGPALVRWPPGFVLRKSDYDVDLDAPGHAELLEIVFDEHDGNEDGVVTADEFVDPVP